MEQQQQNQNRISSVNDADYDREERRELYRVQQAGDEKPSEVGILLTTFTKKETGKLSHGFFNARLLSGPALKIENLRHLVTVVSEIGNEAMNLSAQLIADQCDGDEGKLKFFADTVDDEEHADSILLAICKKTASTEFSGYGQLTNQFLVADRSDLRTKFVRPIYLNDLLLLMNRKFPDEPEFNEETCQFTQMRTRSIGER